MEERKASVGPLFKLGLQVLTPKYPQECFGEVNPFSCSFFWFLPGISVLSPLGVQWPKEKSINVHLAWRPYTFIHFTFSFWPANHPLLLPTYINLGRNWLESWIIQNASWILKNYSVAIQLLLFSPNGLKKQHELFAHIWTINPYFTPLK